MRMLARQSRLQAIIAICSGLPSPTDTTFRKDSLLGKYSEILLPKVMTFFWTVQNYNYVSHGGEATTCFYFQMVGTSLLHLTGGGPINQCWVDKKKLFWRGLEDPSLVWVNKCCFLGFFFVEYWFVVLSYFLTSINNI